MNMITAIKFKNSLWRNSSRSGGKTNCVEFATTAGLVGIRDSKNPDKAILVSSFRQWANFIRGIKNEKFDL
jgi:hypothetical protein